MKTRCGSAILFAALTLALHSTPAAAQDPRASLVVDAAWLASHLNDPDVVVLQVGPEELYAEQHIPGARFASLRMVEAPMPDDGHHERHIALELPPPGELRATLEGFGISDRSLVVVAPSANWITPSARIVFTLDYMGLGERTRYLDGGLEAWKAAGNATSAEVPTVTSGHLTLDPAPRVVSHEWVSEHGSTPGYALLDARAPAFYDGVRDDRGKSGHIPGARSLPWTDLVNDPGDDTLPAYLGSATELRARFREAGVQDGDTVVAYCHVGQFATAVLLAARTLGHEVRLYDGSMNEWAILDLPVEGRGGGG